MKNELFNLVAKYNGNWEKIYKAIKNKDEPKNDLVPQINCVALDDNEYFDKFKYMYFPPFCIFYKGNVNLLKQKIVSLFYKVTNENFSDFINFKNNDYVVCINKKNINKKFITNCDNLGIKLIIVCNTNLKKIPLIETNNIVYISEYYTDKIDAAPQQTSERIIYALANKVYIRDEYNNHITDLYNEHYINEKKQSYYYNISNANEISWLKDVFLEVDNVINIFHK